MKRMPKVLGYFFVALLASGCAPKVITATETGITVDVQNTGLTAGEMMRNGASVAEAHCAKFGKKANFVSTSGFWGAPHLATFECR